jgi:hypothetical protein
VVNDTHMFCLPTYSNLNTTRYYHVPYIFTFTFSLIEKVKVKNNFYLPSENLEVFDDSSFSLGREAGICVICLRECMGLTIFDDKKMFS